MIAHATTDDDAAADRLSLLQALMWFLPRNFDPTPRTPANKAKVKKNIVAPLPPKPVDVNEVIVKGSGRASKLCVRLKGREHGTY